jgi:hypothetical protein
MSAHTHCVAALLLVTACTQVPVAGDLELTEAEIAAMRVEGVIPDAVRSESVRPEPEAEDALEEEAAAETEPAYAGPPRVVVSAFDPDTVYGTALCPFEVEGQGFPSVSVDGHTVVAFIAETLSSSDGEDEIVTVRWMDADADETTERVVVVDGSEDDQRFAFGGSDEADRIACHRLWKRAKVRAARVNAKLASTSWRPLLPMPVDLYEPYDEDPWWCDDDTPCPRRVQLVYQHGQAILRVPGVKVLERRTAAWDDRAYGPDDPCDFFAYPGALLADRETGVAMARVEQEAGPCYCYSPTEYRRVDLSPATYDEIMRRAHT